MTALTVGLWIYMSAFCFLLWSEEVLLGLKTMRSYTKFLKKHQRLQHWPEPCEQQCLGEARRACIRVTTRPVPENLFVLWFCWPSGSAADEKWGMCLPILQLPHFLLVSSNWLKLKRNFPEEVATMPCRGTLKSLRKAIKRHGHVVHAMDDPKLYIPPFIS